MPFINKTLSKVIMARTRLRSNFLKYGSEEKVFKTAEYLGNLNQKKISNNKTFWKNMKHFFSDKTTSTQKITLIEKGKIIMGDDNASEVLKTLFFYIVSNFKIKGYSSCDPLANNISDPVLKSIVKYKQHPSILAIGEVYNKS